MIKYFLPIAYCLLLTINLFAQDDGSRFEVFLRKEDNSPQTGKSVYIVNQTSGDSLVVTEVSGKPGLYRRDTTGIAMYSLYSDGVLLTERFHPTSEIMNLFSISHYPEYDNLVLWDFDDYQTDQDSVDVCFWVDTTTGSWRSYMQATADTTSTDSQYVHYVFSFKALRNVSAISDTLFKVEYQTSVADTDTTAIRLFVYEGSTQRYAESAMTASASWTKKAIRKSQGTLSSIVEGDRFALIVRVKVRYNVSKPYVWLSEIEERWW